MKNKILTGLILGLILLLVGSGLYIDHLENQLETPKIVEKIVEKVITKHDTLIVKIPTIKIVTKFIHSTDTVINPLGPREPYTSWADSASLGISPVRIADTTFSDGNYVRVEDILPPVDQMLITLVPAPDTTITTTIKEKYIIDKTPPMSIIFGVSVLQDQITLQTHFGLNIGLRVNKFSAEYTKYDNGLTEYQLNYHLPFTLKVPFIGKLF